MTSITRPGPGARLRAAREAAGLTRADLAARLGWAESSVANFELDQRVHSLDRIYQVATAIGCDPHAIDSRLAPRKSG